MDILEVLTKFLTSCVLRCVASRPLVSLATVRPEWLLYGPLRGIVWVELQPSPPQSAGELIVQQGIVICRHWPAASTKLLAILFQTLMAKEVLVTSFTLYSHQHEVSRFEQEVIYLPWRYVRPISSDKVR